MSSPPLWREIQRKNISRIEFLAEFLELPTELRARLFKARNFPLNLPLRLAHKLQKGTLDDPLTKQFVPQIYETYSPPQFSSDPVGDVLSQKGKKMLHKYFGRALLLTTGACAMHCRYCFRQHFSYESSPQFSEEIAYLKERAEITEVILSGGDPLSLSNGTLSQLLNQLSSIPHIRRIRFHTRFLIGIPERVDPPFLEMLSNCSKQVIFVLHINHLKETDEEVFKSIQALQNLRIPCLVQSVLLKGVNDKEETLFDLYSELTNRGILPYYLHLLDQVKGSAHFEVSQERGEELIAYLRDHLSGFAVPRLAKEEAGRKSKTVLC